MTCEEARAAFTDLYDGRLAGPSLATLSRHIEDCRACRTEWAAFQAAVRALQSLGAEEPTPGFAAKVVARIEAPRWWERLVRSLVLPVRVKLPMHAVALVMLCLTGLWLYHGSPELQRATGSRTAAVEEPPVSPPRQTLTAEPQPAAPAPSSKGRREAPIAAQEQGGAAPAPHAPNVAPSPQAQPPVPAGQGAASEMAAPQPLRSAQARLESRRRDEAPQPAPGPPAAAGLGSPDEIFSTAATAYTAGRYDNAIAGLHAFLAQYPGDSRVPDARFLLAEAYLAQHRYAASSAEFQTFLRQYPDHRRAPAARFLDGEARLRLGDRAGCDILRDALTRYPGAPEADAAREMLSARCP